MTAKPLQPKRCGTCAAWEPPNPDALRGKCAAMASPHHGWIRLINSPPCAVGVEKQDDGE